jgi:hypothetical protein
VKVSVSGATAWRFYEASFQLLGSGAGAGEVVLRAGPGTGYLLVYGAPGGSVGVTVE